ISLTLSANGVTYPCCPVNSPCDDNQFCTSQDRCNSSGACVGVFNVTLCPNTGASGSTTVPAMTSSLTGTFFSTTRTMAESASPGSSSTGSKGSNAGTIAAAVLVPLLVLGLLASVAVLVFRLREKQRKKMGTATTTTNQAIPQDSNNNNHSSSSA